MRPSTEGIKNMYNFSSSLESEVGERCFRMWSPAPPHLEVWRCVPLRTSEHSHDGGECLPQRGWGEFLVELTLSLLSAPSFLNN